MNTKRMLKIAGITTLGAALLAGGVTALTPATASADPGPRPAQHRMYRGGGNGPMDPADRPFYRQQEGETPLRLHDPENCPYYQENGAPAGPNNATPGVPRGLGPQFQPTP